MDEEIEDSVERNLLGRAKIFVLIVFVVFVFVVLARYVAVVDLAWDHDVLDQSGRSNEVLCLSVDDVWFVVSLQIHLIPSTEHRYLVIQNMRSSFSNF